MNRRRLLVSLAALLLASSVFTQAQEPTDPLVGIYTCDGLNHDGAAYRALVAIEANGAAYVLRWELVGDPQRQVGIALRQNDVLSVIFQTDSGAVGLSSYAIEQDEKGLRLLGRWLMPGVAAVSREVLTKTAARSIDELRQLRGL